MCVTICVQAMSPAEPAPDDRVAPEFVQNEMVKEGTRPLWPPPSLRQCLAYCGEP